MTDLKLYSYQEGALSLFKQAERRGSLIYATGTGKTEVAIGIIKEFIADFPTGKVIFIVPRIVLIEQTAQRMSGYGFSSTSYYGENKDLSGEVVVSTYQSLCKIEELESMIDAWLVKHSNVLFVFDEVHLASDQAANYIRIMKSAKQFTPAKVSMLALTATIDELDEKNATILEACPVIDKIQMGEAIEKGFLSEVKVFDSGVELTPENFFEYENLMTRLQNIFRELNTSNPVEIKNFCFSRDYNLRNLAYGYFKVIAAKNAILNFDSNKIAKAVELIRNNSGKTLLFAERVHALELMNEAINDQTVYRYIEAKTPKKLRRQIIEDFKNGKFQVLGTVHTLDIGFDQKDISNCIFMASNKNDNQLIQRLGRGVRKAEGKAFASIFIIYAKRTGEKDLFGMINDAIVQGRSEQSVPVVEQKKQEPVAQKKPFEMTWKEGKLLAKGNTFPHKEVLKQHNFWWEKDGKVWSRVCAETEVPQIVQAVSKALIF